jgi:hypothetical protein
LWVSGRPWQYDDMFTEVSGVLFTKDRFEVPSMF